MRSLPPMICAAVAVLGIAGCASAVAGAFAQEKPQATREAAETAPRRTPVLERGDRRYVTAEALEENVGVAIKGLPGREQVVACWHDRCGLVKEFVREGDAILLPVTAVAEALGAQAEYDAERKYVGFALSDKPPAGQGPSAGVGRIAPDLRLTKLDGTSVSLKDFRGKRVLVNSWASW